MKEENAKETLDNKSLEEDINTLFQKDHIVIKQPKLLRIKKNDMNNVQKIIPNLNDEYKKENKVIKKRIKELKEIDKQLKEEEHNAQLERNLTSFYRNPFCYMDYLVKKYFKEKANLLENYGIKQSIMNDFNTFTNEIEKKLHNFTQSELFKLKRLQNQIDKKLNINQAKPTDENSNLNAEPITSQDKLNIIFNPSSFKNTNDKDAIEKKMLVELNGIVSSKQDAEDIVINDPTSDLHKENLFNQALACLKGEKIIPPKRSFLTTTDLQLKDVNRDNLIDSKNISKLQSKAEWYNALKEHPIPDFYGRQKVLDKNKKDKQKEKEDFYAMIGESEKQIEQMNRISKENDELIRYVKDKVDNDFNKEAIKVGMTKLSIYQHNLEQIHKDFDDMKSDQLCVNYDEMQKEMDYNYNYLLEKTNNFLKGKKYKNPDAPIDDNDIDDLYKKYAKKEKVAKTKRKFNNQSTNPFLHNYFYKTKK